MNLRSTVISSRHWCLSKKRKTFLVWCFWQNLPSLPLSPPPTCLQRPPMESISFLGNCGGCRSFSVPWRTCLEAQLSHLLFLPSPIKRNVDLRNLLFFFPERRRERERGSNSIASITCRDKIQEKKKKKRKVFPDFYPPPTRIWKEERELMLVEQNFVDSNP